jgi:iron complex transport system ATP-binding protein
MSQQTVATAPQRTAGEKRSTAAENRSLEAARARRLAVVLTQQVKVWGLTSRELVALGRHPHESMSAVRRPADEGAVDRALAICGADALADRQLAELSDGERQRVMVARALAQEPLALVVDEVTAFLDLPHRVDIMLMLRRLAHTAGVAMLLSTHDLDLALRTADRIWLIAPGGAFSIGTPESLVLSGALDGVFRHDGVRFDRHTGSFSLQERRHGRATVAGAGLHAEWTRRAVERLGYQVAQEGPADLHVTVAEGHTAPAWELAAAGQAMRYTTLDALADAIRELRPTPGSRA